MFPAFLFFLQSPRPFTLLSLKTADDDLNSKSGFYSDGVLVFNVITRSKVFLVYSELPCSFPSCLSNILNASAEGICLICICQVWL